MRMSITVSVLPPQIKQTFNKNLLMTYIERIKYDLETKIIPLSNKKIRPQDVGKRKQFESLKNKFMDTYERKKIAQLEYDAEKKKKAEEMPSFSTTETTRIFRHMDTGK